jgi:hypothetical protein
MPLYDFRDGLGHTTEAIRSSGVYEILCDQCGATATRVAANRVSFKAPDIDSRGMFRRFTEATAEIDHAASKVEADTGQPVQTPNLWGAARQRAAAIERVGESPLPSPGRIT